MAMQSNKNVTSSIVGTAMKMITESDNSGISTGLMSNSRKKKLVHGYNDVYICNFFPLIQILFRLEESLTSLLELLLFSYSVSVIVNIVQARYY